MKIKPGVVYFIGSLGGLLFGIDSGLTGGVMSPARHTLGLTPGQEVLMANIVTFGAAIMALFAGVLNDKYGRKKMFVTSAIVFVIGAAFCSVAWDATTLTVARLCLGLGIGIASATVPAFLAELAPAAKRSGIATLFQFAIVIGLNVAYVVDFAVLGTGKDTGFAWIEHSFQLMLGFALIPAVVLFVCALFIPESPRFLARNGQIAEAKEVLLGMRNGNQADADAEFAEIEQVLNEPTGGVKDLLTFGKKPLIAALGVAFMQQLVGINAAFYYGPVIAGSVIPHPHPGAAEGTSNWFANLAQDQLYSILFGTVNVLATVVTVLVMNRVSSYKKTLYLGGAIMGIFSVLFFILINTNNFGLGEQGGMLAIIMVCAYIIGFAFSWGPLTWNIIGEIFPLSVRGIGASLGAAANWFSNFTVMSVFGIIILKNADGVAEHVDYGFALFAVGCVLAIAYTYFVVPETKNRSLEDIEEGFRKEGESAGDGVALGAIAIALILGTLGALILPVIGLWTPAIAWTLIVVVAALFIVPIVTKVTAK